ncbi:MAG: hypothetical protein ABEJ74_03755 [Haloferacaceae archaeon]
MTDRSRRRYLSTATTLAAAATAGCLGLFEKEPVRLRALPADGDETDVRCTLSPAFVRRYPALEAVLTKAGRTGERAERGVSTETGTGIGDALAEHCDGETRGLYRYDDQWFFVSISFRNPEDHREAEGDHHHGNGTVTEHAH